MSFVLDIFIWLLIETALGFIFYTTGSFMLKVVTFGQFNIKFKDFSSFKEDKTKKVNSIILLGFSFYVLLIVLIAYLNN